MLVKVIRIDNTLIGVGKLKRETETYFTVDTVSYQKKNFRYELASKCGDLVRIKGLQYRVELIDKDQMILQRTSDGMMLMVVFDPSLIEPEPEFKVGDYVTVTGYKHCSLDKSYQGYFFKIIGIEQDFYMLKHVDFDGEIRLKRDAWFFAKATKTNVNNLVAKELLPED